MLHLNPEAVETSVEIKRSLDTWEIIVVVREVSVCQKEHYSDWGLMLLETAQEASVYTMTIPAQLAD